MDSLYLSWAIAPKRCFARYNVIKKYKYNMNEIVEIVLLELYIWTVASSCFC